MRSSRLVQTISKRYAFIIDHSYELVNKMRENHGYSFPQQLTSYSNYPSHFARNLLHPLSEHPVSKYAKDFYSKSKSHFGDLSITFLPSEIVHTIPSKETQEPGKHTLLLWPDNVQVPNIDTKDIPDAVGLCRYMQTIPPSPSSVVIPPFQKRKGVTVFFFCDIDTVERSIKLLEWFSYGFKQNDYDDVSYVFSCGNFQYQQNAHIIISDERQKNRAFPFLISYHEILVIVGQLTSKSNR